MTRAGVGATGARGAAPVRARTRTWVLVAGGFHGHGGMDRANLELAEHLLRAGARVHLVAHDVAPALAGREGAQVHRVRRPAGAFVLGDPFLARAAAGVARRVRAADPAATVLVNGGLGSGADVNWVHSVHHEWRAEDDGAPIWFRAKNRLARAAFRRAERRAVLGSRVVIANSRATREALLRHLRLPPERVHVVYPGADPALRPPTQTERDDARRWLGVPAGRPVVVFVGALGHDRNKGFDTVLAAWRMLATGQDWDGVLVAAGGGRGWERWRGEVWRSGLGDGIRLLGHSTRIPELLAAADLLVSPARYEGYGLNVQEAIGRGVPAVVARRAGVAERFPAGLEPLLLEDPSDASALAGRLRMWRSSVSHWAGEAAAASEAFRAYSWRDMATRLVELGERGAGPADARPDTAVRLARG